MRSVHVITGAQALGLLAVLATLGAAVGAQTPAWSADGSKVAFSYSLVREDFDASLDLQRAIWIVNADGADRSQLTQVVMRPDGSKLRPLTKTSLWESSVDWGRAARPRGR